MTKINVLLLCGGGGSEHEISLLSADFIDSHLLSIDDIAVFKVIIEGLNWVDSNGAPCYLTTDGLLIVGSESIEIDYAIPCFHGYPGETGEIQTLFKVASIPYLGCGTESSVICFNKITSKLWFSQLGLPNVPFIYLSDNREAEQKKSLDFLNQHKQLYVKAASQGSSVGCYMVNTEAQLLMAIKDAFHYSSRVLIEKSVVPRELEIAAYEFNGELIITEPGEVIAPGHFYNYDEKYSANSHSTTKVVAENLTPQQRSDLKAYAHLAFTALKLKDLSRIDFFLTETGEIFINEINTFPGMTPNSLFPKMMENHGTSFANYLRTHIFSSLTMC